MSRGHPLSPDVIEKISEAHRRGMGLSQAGKYAGVHRVTVYEHWRKMGLETHGSMQLPLSDDVVGLLYTAWELGYNNREIGKILKIHYETVGRYLKASGLYPRGGASERKTPEETINLFIAAWELGYTAQQTADILGSTDDSVRKYLKAFGLKPHRSYPHLPEEKIKRIQKACELGMSRPEGAKYAGVSKSSFDLYKAEMSRS